MPLILTLTSLRGGMPPEQRSLAEGTICLGRGPASDWVLADPERLLSKRHCLVGMEGSRFVLTDLSTNGVFVNGAREPTARDSRVFLTDGDSFRLGDYTVTVSEVDRLPERRAAASGGDFASAAHADPFGDDADDPFGSEPGTMFRHPIPPRTEAWRGEDPFAPQASSGPARGRGGDAFGDDDLFQGIAPDPSWQGAAQPDKADAPRHAFSAPQPLPAPVDFNDLDLDALLGDEPPGAPPHKPVQAAPAHAQAWPQAHPPAQTPRHVPQQPMPREDWPAPAQAAQPAAYPGAAPPYKPAQHAPAPGTPSQHAPAPAPAPPYQAPGAAHAPLAAPPHPADAPPHLADAPLAVEQTHAADARALAAFLNGAGVPDLNAGGADPAAFFLEAGLVFRAMAEGLREVLMSRAAIKNELRVEQTMLRARNNNALKFSITADDAVAALLAPRPGYLAPAAAATEACRDIQSHEMAVMAGVQTALIGLLKRFDPAALEARLQPGKLDNFLPGARKARIWELFCATYADIAREAEDDFQSVFGREFAKAYDAQMRRL